MIQVWYAIAVAISAATTPKTLPVQFAKSLSGRMVRVCIDGKVEETFAGKMGFRDANQSWPSVCADVRSPVHRGQFFMVQPLSSAKVGGGYAAAGNIVAKFFRSAVTADECAGLQLSVWKAIEDPGMPANFLAGHFQAQGSPAVMMFAQQFSEGAEAPGDATFLWAGGGGGQSQLSPTAQV